MVVKEHNIVLGIHADPGAQWLAPLANDGQQRFITELSHGAVDGCDALLVDIRFDQQQILSRLATLNLRLPLIVVVGADHDFSSGYPHGCAIGALVSQVEIGSTTFWQRVREAIDNFSAPMQLSTFNTPIFAALQSLVDNTSDWIFIKDLDHRFLLASEAFAAEAGFTIEQIIGMNDLELGNSPTEVFGDPATGWKGFWPQDDEVTSSGKISIEDNPNWTLYSDTPRYKRTLRVPLSNEKGVVYGLLVITQDITEQKQNEVMLRERTEMLARVTSEKKKADENRRVAEEAVNAKNKFLAAASHDLRQPLHAMGLFLDVLESRLNGSDNLALMQRVKQSCASLNSLFNSLLDISRLDAGVVEKNCEDIPSARLLSSLREEFRHQAIEKNLEYIDNVDSSVMYSDFTLISRVVRNLVINAIDNTESGCITVTCQQSNANVLLSVGDTGFGIPPEERALIFTEFHQIDSQVAEKGRGLGLGLAIVKRLCDLLDIEISLQSTLGKGSCFLLRIPVGDASSIESTHESSRPVNLSGINVLVVDDERVIREGMEAVLQSYDCLTITAGSLDETLQLLDEAESIPDIVVADYQLARNVTGVDVIDAIRDRLGRQVPALLVTGDTGRERLQVAADRDLPIVHKPVDPDLLLSAIAQQLFEQSL